MNNIKTYENYSRRLPSEEIVEQAIHWFADILENTYYMIDVNTSKVGKNWELLITFRSTWHHLDLKDVVNRLQKFINSYLNMNLPVFTIGKTVKFMIYPENIKAISDNYMEHRFKDMRELRDFGFFN